ncbi:CBS domain-containing protein [Puniceicoccaceae bacterium K14]|nr:CBS domain-containing protein [Puniceicoccaceae bacterium K14]
MSTVNQLLESKKQHSTLISITPDKSTYEALQLMAKEDIGAIPVIEDSKLVGILTEREYARKIVLHGKTSRITPVRDTMCVDFPIVTRSANIDDCMQLMTQKRFRYVAVKENDELIGLISIGDVVKNVIANQQANIDALQQYITGG